MVTAELIRASRHTLPELERRTRELHGVAPSTWIMAWVEAVIWTVYGLFVVDAALLAGGISGAMMASLILGRLAITGHEPFRIARPARALA